MTDPTRPPVSARRVAVGFKAGAQVLSLRLTDDVLEQLRSALQDGRDDWLEVEATDGAVLIDLDAVAYLRVESGEHRVGFQRVDLHALRRSANATDLALYRAVRSLARDQTRTRWIRRYSRLGEHAALWVGIGVAGALVDAPRRRQWRCATASVLGANGLSTAIKFAIGRVRPVVEDLPHLMATPTGLSFPSSHSTSSFAAAAAYGRLLPRPPLYAAATAMALSRLYLGVHYPSDIAAGAALGTAVGGLLCR